MSVICNICGKEFTKEHLGHHLSRTHSMNAVDYYYKYISKDTSDGKCKTCGKPTKFKSLNAGFRQFCGLKCSNSNKEKILKTENGCIEKYGVRNVFQVEDIKSKIKETNIKELGVDNPSKSKIIKDKKEETIIKNYGDNYLEIMLERRKATCIKKYGVEYYQQSWEGTYKSIKSSYKKKPYILPSGRTVYKQGYEPQLLDYIFSKDLIKEEEIEYYPKGIKYLSVDNKMRYYFPDIFIPKLRLIIECKSTWTLQTDFNLINKENEVKKLGINYIRIVNNDFSELDELLSLLFLHTDSKI